MNFCAGLAPHWAEEIRHPDMTSTEFWLHLGVVQSGDFHEEVAIGVVQNGPDGVPNVSIGGIRFSAEEASAYQRTLGAALDVVGADGGTSTRTQGPGDEPDDLSPATRRGAAGT